MLLHAQGGPFEAEAFSFLQKIRFRPQACRNDTESHKPAE